MSGDTDLTSEHAVGAYFGRACDTYLRGHDCVVSHFNIVGYLYQIVELGSAGDVCAAHHRSVDCCIGAYFNIVGKLHNAELLDFVIYAIGIRSEAEAIGTEYGTGG